MFESQNLRLIAAGEDEFKIIYEFFNDYDLIAGIRHCGSVVHPLTFEEFKKNNDNDCWTKFAVVLKKSGQIIGFAELTIEEVTRVAYPMTYLKKEERGNGYGTELSKLLTSIAFNEFNASKIRTLIFSFNVASYKRYERLGWKLEGTLRNEVFRSGRYWDVLYYGLLRSEWEADIKQINIQEDSLVNADS